MKAGSQKEETTLEREGQSEIGDLLQQVTLTDSERLSDEEFITTLWKRIALTVESEELAMMDEKTQGTPIPQNLTVVPAKPLTSAGVESAKG